jgi:hypothetical protein
MKSSILKLAAIPFVLFASAATAQVSGGGVTGGGVTGGGGAVSGGLSSDFASANTPAGNASSKGGLGPALERVFGDQQQGDADAECAKLGKCD